MDGYGPNPSELAESLAATTLVAGITNPLTAMGRIATAEASPIIRGDFSYGLPTGAFITQNSAGTGALAGKRGYGEVTTGGTASGAYATMFTPRPQRFRDGQGVETYFTVKYDTPVAGAVQLAGAFTAEDGYGLGYGNDPFDPPYDTDFKVFRKSGGLRQIETLELTGSSGSGDIDITIGGATVRVTLSASTLEQNAAEIAAEDYGSWVAFNYSTDGTDAFVVFVCDNAGPQTAGVYASVSGSPATGTFTTTTTGERGNESWLPQSSWNIDGLGGSGNALNPSGLTLNPQHWNLFGMRWTDTYCEWFWFGPDGRFHPFHREVATTEELVTNSAMPIQFTAYNIGTVASAVTMQVAGFAGAVSGELLVVGARRSRSTATLGVGSTLVPLVSYRLAAAYAGPNSLSARAFTGLAQIILCDIGNDGNRGCVIEIVLNADLVLPQWRAIAGINSSAVREAVGGSFSVAGQAGGVTIGGTNVSKSSTKAIDVDKLILMLLRGQTITLAGRSLTTTTDITVTVTEVEER